MSIRCCIWLLFIFSIMLISIDGTKQRLPAPPADLNEMNYGLVRVLNVQNKMNYLGHTALEVSYPGFNQTYGFYSTYSGWKFWFYGWLAHRGVVRNPDLFLVGSIKVPRGSTVGPDIQFNLTRVETMALTRKITKEMTNPGLYSYINRQGVDNCVSWVEYLLNPILTTRGKKLDCSLNKYMSLSVPGYCQVVND